jgi:hypothetical protein
MVFLTMAIMAGAGTFRDWLINPQRAYHRHGFPAGTTLTIVMGACRPEKPLTLKEMEPVRPQADLTSPS